MGKPESKKEITIVEAIETFLRITGSTWIDEDSLRKNFSSLRDLKQLQESGKIIAARKDNNSKWFFTLPKYHETENSLCKNIIRLISVPAVELDRGYVDTLIHKASAKLHIQLGDEQYAAVVMAVYSTVCILTGSAGTGKTSVLKVIREVLKMINNDCTILFTAPTGKAARKITESVGDKAYTLHKKLKITENNMNSSPLIVDILISDETSMLDLFVADATFKAIQTGSKVILVGDIKQLPSIGVGAVLRDLISSGILPVTMLNRTYRQDNSTILFANIINICNGINKVESGVDFLVANPSAEHSAVSLIISAYIVAVKKYGVESTVCLTPFRKGKKGSDNLNKILQNIINPKSPQKKEIAYHNQFTDAIFRENDMVMQLKNRLECANGDVGKIIEVNEDKNEVIVQYIDGCVTYYHSQLYQITLSYAMSIHKSQGSEYPAVVMCILNEHKRMLERNLLYTGVTRAKKIIYLIYDASAYAAAINNTSYTKRITMLSEKLCYFKNLAILTRRVA